MSQLFTSKSSSTMLGEKAMELVREAARSGGGAGGSGGGGANVPFNEDLVRQVLEECRALYERNRADVERLGEATPAVHLRHAALGRNRRCLLAYLDHRAGRARAMRWQFGSVLPAEARAGLCEPEAAFFARYSRLLASYMRSVGGGGGGGVEGLDLTTDLRPPKSLYVEVRCLEDYGEMETDDGDLVVLRKNTQHYLPRALCEPLIRQGVLEHVKS